MKQFHSDGKVLVKRVVREQPTASFGDELRQIVSSVEAVWEDIPESFRADVSRDDLVLFAQGWKEFNEEAVKDLLRLNATRAARQFEFEFRATPLRAALEPKTLGRMRALTYFLTNNDISWTSNWDSPAVVYTIVARWM